jgi:ABC-type uncharacterized transport system ATPase subunit
LLLSETEKLVKQVLILPTGTAVSSGEIHNICQIIRLVVSNGNEIKEKLASQVAEATI